MTSLCTETDITDLNQDLAHFNQMLASTTASFERLESALATCGVSNADIIGPNDAEVQCSPQSDLRSGSSTITRHDLLDFGSHLGGVVRSCKWDGTGLWAWAG